MLYLFIIDPADLRARLWAMFCCRSVQSLSETVHISMMQWVETLHRWVPTVTRDVGIW